MVLSILFALYKMIYYYWADVNCYIYPRQGKICFFSYGFNDPNYLNKRKGLFVCLKSKKNFTTKFSTQEQRWTTGSQLVNVLATYQYPELSHSYKFTYSEQQSKSNSRNPSPKKMELRGWCSDNNVLAIVILELITPRS